MFISIIAVTMLAPYVPNLVEQPSCCSCCKTMTCGCGCNLHRISSGILSSKDIPTCDFKTCNGTIPLNTSIPVFIKLNYAESIKKLTAGIGLENGKRTIYLCLSYGMQTLFYYTPFITSACLPTKFLLYPIRNISITRVSVNDLCFYWFITILCRILPAQDRR